MITQNLFTPLTTKLLQKKISENEEKAHARHEFLGNIELFMEKGYKILKKKGFFFLIYPVKKMQHVFKSAEKSKLYCKEILFIKEYMKAEPSLFLSCFIKGESSNMITSCDFLVMKDDNGIYTEKGSRVMYDPS